MDIIRVERKEGDYFQMYKAAFKDKNLSLKARGLLATILSLPSTWDFSIKGLAAILKEKRDAIYNTINELIEGGYCIRESQRDEFNRFGNTTYTFFECPCTECPHSEKPHTENPDTEKPTQYKNTSNSRYTKELRDTKDKEKDLVLPFDSLEFFTTWEMLIAEPEWKKKSHNALQIALNKLGKMTEQDAIESMNNTIAGGWRGIFPVEHKQVKQQEKPKSFVEEIQEQRQRVMEQIYGTGFSNNQ